MSEAESEVPATLDVAKATSSIEVFLEHDRLLWAKTIAFPIATGLAIDMWEGMRLKLNFQLSHIDNVSVSSQPDLNFIEIQCLIRDPGEHVALFWSSGIPPFPIYLEPNLNFTCSFHMANRSIVTATLCIWEVA